MSTTPRPPSTPKKPTARHEHDTPTRVRAITLLKEGKKVAEIARKVGVPRTTVHGWKKSPHPRRTHHRSGRPKSLDKHDVRRLIALARRDWEGRKLSWSRLAKSAGLSVSGKTVKRALNEKGYTRCKACKKPLISRKCQKDRKEYGREHLHKPLEYWRNHIYTDECSFDTSQTGTTWVTRLPGERYHDHCIEHTRRSSRGTVMIWAAISYNWKSPLVFIEGKHGGGMQAIDYLEQALLPVVAPAFNGADDFYNGYLFGGEYVEDGAGPHGQRGILKGAKERVGIPVHKRPSTSPDLNPIENVWRLLKQRIKARSPFPNTVPKMREAIQEEWDKLQPGDWNEYIDSMPERIREVVARKGMQTPY